MKLNMNLYNFLENKEATPEQSHDLISLRAIGQSFEGIVNSILKTSTNAPTRNTYVHSLFKNSMLNNLKKRKLRNIFCMVIGEWT